MSENEELSNKSLIKKLVKYGPSKEDYTNSFRVPTSRRQSRSGILAVPNQKPDVSTATSRRSSRRSSKPQEPSSFLPSSPDISYTPRTLIKKVIQSQKNAANASNQSEPSISFQRRGRSSNLVLNPYQEDLEEDLKENQAISKAEHNQQPNKRTRKAITLKEFTEGVEAIKSQIGDIIGETPAQPLVAPGTSRRRRPIDVEDLASRIDDLKNKTDVNIDGSPAQQQLVAETPKTQKKIRMDAEALAQAVETLKKSQKENVNIDGSPAQQQLVAETPKTQKKIRMDAEALAQAVETLKKSQKEKKVEKVTLPSQSKNEVQTTPASKTTPKSVLKTSGQRSTNSGRRVSFGRIPLSVEAIKKNLRVSFEHSIPLKKTRSRSISINAQQLSYQSFSRDNEQEPLELSLPGRKIRRKSSSKQLLPRSLSTDDIEEGTGESLMKTPNNISLGKIYKSSSSVQSIRKSGQKFKSPKKGAPFLILQRLNLVMKPVTGMGDTEELKKLTPSSSRGGDRQESPTMKSVTTESEPRAAVQLTKSPSSSERSEEKLQGSSQKSSTIKPSPRKGSQLVAVAHTSKVLSSTTVDQSQEITPRKAITRKLELSQPTDGTSLKIMVEPLMLPTSSYEVNQRTPKSTSKPLRSSSKPSPSKFTPVRATGAVTSDIVTAYRDESLNKNNSPRIVFEQPEVTEEQLTQAIISHMSTLSPVAQQVFYDNLNRGTQKAMEVLTSTPANSLNKIVLKTGTSKSSTPNQKSKESSFTFDTPSPGFNENMKLDLDSVFSAVFSPTPKTSHKMTLRDTSTTQSRKHLNLEDKAQLVSDNEQPFEEEEETQVLSYVDDEEVPDADITKELTGVMSEDEMDNEVLTDTTVPEIGNDVAADDDFSGDDEAKKLTGEMSDVDEEHSEERTEAGVDGDEMSDEELGNQEHAREKSEVTNDSSENEADDEEESMHGASHDNEVSDSEFEDIEEEIVNKAENQKAQSLIKKKKKIRQKSNLNALEKYCFGCFQHFASPLPVHPDCLNLVYDSLIDFQDVMIKELQDYAHAAKRKSIKESDIALFMKRKEFINKKSSLQSLIYKFMPTRLQRIMRPLPAHYKPEKL